MCRASKRIAGHGRRLGGSGPHAQWVVIEYVLAIIIIPGIILNLI